MSENFVDFRAIKQLVSMKSLLDRYGVQLRKVNQNSLRGRCPLPTHTSEQSSESFVVHTGKNIWACQSSSCSAARQGRKGGNVLDFVAAMQGCSIRDAAIKLHEWFATPSAGAAAKSGVPSTGKAAQLVADKREGSDEREINKPLTFTLKNVDPMHPYLRQRGITEETARTFGVGFFSGRGSMAGRIVFPIHNERGELVAYAGRSIDDAEPKYKLPAGFHKSAELFNLHRALASGGECLILVEGFFDCMKVHEAGFSHTVALMGCSLSEHQEQLLLRQFKKVTLLLDGDSAGREAARRIANRLILKMFVRVIDLPDGKQPDQVFANEIRELLD